MSNPQEEIDPQGAEATVRAAFGQVVNVRSIPTRAVTRIEIEIPIESHVEATRLLFGQDVFVMPASVESGEYGMVDGSLPATKTQRPHQAARNEAAPAAARPARLAGFGLRSSTDSLDILKWLGTRCREDGFQDWLGVRTEAAAVQKVRDLCGVESRSEIPQNRQARQAFLTRIFEPYRAAMQQSESSGG